MISEDKLWIPSAQECGLPYNTAETSGVYYSSTNSNYGGFSNSNSTQGYSVRKRSKYSEPNIYLDWWTRSVSYNNQNRFFFAAGSNGALAYSSPSTAEKGVLFGFCI